MIAIRTDILYAQVYRVSRVLAPRLFGDSRFGQTLAPVAHRFSTGGPQQGAGRIYHAAVLVYD